MAGQVNPTPTFALQPSAQQVVTQANYMTDFSFINQYLPDTYEKEFERYGNRTVASFLRMVGAEMPCNSDLIKWAEQGRLHQKYLGCTLGSHTGAETVQTITIPKAQMIPANGNVAIRVGQTIMLSDEAAGSSFSNKAIVTGVTLSAAGVNDTIAVAYYEATQAAYPVGASVSIFIYGSEFNKGAVGMSGSNEADDIILDNKPIIIKDLYEVSGSDMAQIGWIEVTTENGATGYLWYLKSAHDRDWETS